MFPAYKHVLSSVTKNLTRVSLTESFTRNTSTSSKNVIAAYYVNAEGNPKANHQFDSLSSLPNDVKSNVNKFVEEKGMTLKPGTSRTFFWPGDAMPYKSLSLAAIPYDPVPDQMVDLKKEYTRQAFASSIRTLSGYKETEVLIDNVADMCSVSEGSHLAAYNFDMYKSEKSQ